MNWGPNTVLTPAGLGDGVGLAVALLAHDCVGQVRSKAYARVNDGVAERAL